MYNYVLREEDRKQLAELRATLLTGALARSTEKNAPLPQGIDIRHPDLVATSVVGHFSQIIIDFSNIRNLTEEEAVAIARALAGTPVSTVWVKGICFTGNSILALVANLPANISNLVINNGGLTKDQVEGFAAALSRNKVQEANLNNNLLGDASAEKLCARISDPLRKLYLLNSGISATMQDTCSDILRGKGMQLSFGADVLVAKGVAISSLGNFNGQGYAYARLLAIALLKSELEITQDIADVVQPAYATLLKRGEVDFTHVNAPRLDQVLVRLEDLFKLPQPAYSTEDIVTKTTGLGILNTVVDAARIAVLSVLNIGVPCDVVALQAAKIDLDKIIADAEEARKKLQAMRKLQHHEAALVKKSGTTLPMLNAQQAAVVDEATDVKRALSLSRGKTEEEIVAIIAAHKAQCVRWIQAGKSGEVDKATKSDRAKLPAPV